MADYIPRWFLIIINNNNNNNNILCSLDQPLSKRILNLIKHLEVFIAIKFSTVVSCILDSFIFQCFVSVNQNTFMYISYVASESQTHNSRLAECLRSLLAVSKTSF